MQTSVSLSFSGISEVSVYDYISSGNTVELQYSSGIYKIASWSHITNAHTVPGPSVVTGLASVGLPLGRGLLLLAEMSTKGSLAVGEYTRSSVQMALDHPDFVIGFIAMNRMDGLATELGYAGKDLLILTPGVGLDSRGDGKGQQYRTPKEVIEESQAQRRSLVEARARIEEEKSLVEEL